MTERPTSGIRGFVVRPFALSAIILFMLTARTTFAQLGVTLVSPADGGTLAPGTVNFDCDAVDDTGVRSVTLRTNDGSGWVDVGTEIVPRQAYPMLSGMQLWMHLDETANPILDSSGFGRHGTASNAVYISTGEIAGAYSFDGIDNNPGIDFITLPSNTYGLPGASGATMAAWVRPSVSAQSAASGTIIFVDRAGASATRMLISVNSNRTVSVKARSDNETLATVTATSTTILPTGVWSHIVGVVDLAAPAGAGGTAKIYINGVLDTTASLPLTLDAFAATTATNPCIGGISGATGFSFKGDIDEAAIYNRALSDAEVKLLYDGVGYTTWNASFAVSMSSGCYTWNCEAEDFDANTALAPADYALTISGVCGNAIVECDEECDGGDCCTAGCLLVTAGTECRASAGDCDVAETCDGAAADCPTDVLVTSGTECRASAGDCDVAESCDGAAADCPADAKSTAECRVSGGACDPAEFCDGANNDCPADAKSTAVCRVSGGVCDPAESCDGANNDCPADAKSTAVCRVSGGVCDPAESCDGANNDCPADVTITSCVNGDGCCPIGCSSGNDNDCGLGLCGDDIVDAGEECDGAADAACAGRPCAPDCTCVVALQVALVSPADGATVPAGMVTMECDAFDESGLRSVTLFSDISGTWGPVATQNVFPAPTGTQLWMHLDETSSPILDSSGFARNGTVAGAVSIPDGQIGRAYSFNGISQNITLPSSTYGFPGASGGTMSAWVRPAAGQSASSGAGTIIFIDRNAGVATRMLISVNNTHTVSVKARSNAEGTLPLSTTTAILPTGVWSHIVGVIDLATPAGAGGTAQIYINGVLSKTEVLAALTDDTFFNTTATNAGIGAITGNTTFSFLGDIDEVAVFNRVLSATEVAQLYAGAPLQYTASFDVPVATLGAYEWNCEAQDVDLNTAWAPSNFSFTVAVPCDDAADCFDDNPCTDDVCTAGFCSNPNNTAPCDDGLYCTDPDVCSGGVCVQGAPRDCSASADQCNMGVCNEGTDQCEPQPVADGTGCDDGIACTHGDNCQSGVCVDGAVPDCNGNSISDECDIADCTGNPDCGDCNDNGVPDLCDILDLTSSDCNADGIPDECAPVLAPSAEPNSVSKCRALSFVPVNSGRLTGLRVRLVALQHVDPPYTGGVPRDLSQWEGEVRWVGAPRLYVESEADPTTFYASVLQCEPEYRDWSTIGLIHVFGSEVVPSSAYHVQAVLEECGISNEADYSDPLVVTTTRWGDVVAPFAPPSETTQPDTADLSALVNKFRSAAGAPIKARAALAGTIPDLGVDIGFTQISACVDAFKGLPFPYTIVECP